VLVLDMIEILPPLGKYKYDTWRILPVKCYIDNSMHLRSYIRNVNKHFWLKAFFTRTFWIPRLRDYQQISGITTATRIRTDGCPEVHQ
jgi:hypothetical protein